MPERFLVNCFKHCKVLVVKIVFFNGVENYVSHFNNFRPLPVLKSLPLKIHSDFNLDKFMQ